MHLRTFLTGFFSIIEHEADNPLKFSVQRSQANKEESLQNIKAEKNQNHANNIYSSINFELIGVCMACRLAKVCDTQLASHIRRQSSWNLIVCLGLVASQS